MRENRKIIEAIQSHKNEKLVLATIVYVQGSAYRKEGSKMLIGEKGIIEGTISGGCIEPDLVEVSKNIMKTEKPQLKMYDLDEDLLWGLGMGCPGKVYIFLQPMIRNEEKESPLNEWMQSVKSGETAILCTVLNDAQELKLIEGEQFFIKKEGTLKSTLNDQTMILKEKMMNVARKKFQESSPTPSTELFTINKASVHVFFDITLRPDKLLIFGAGRDAIPLNSLATKLGFHTTIIDPREAYNRKQHFPAAQCLLVDVTQEELDVEICPNTSIVIMNHHLKRDREALAHALKSQATYIGILGSKARVSRIYKSLNSEEERLLQSKIDKLYGPVGLDIGAQNEEEIALSIMSEIFSMKNGASSKSLREVKGSII